MEVPHNKNTTAGGRRENENPASASAEVEAQILEASPSIGRTESEVDSSLLLQTTESGDSSILTIKEGDTLESKLEYLREFTTLKRPGGISFRKALRAIKTGKAKLRKVRKHES